VSAARSGLERLSPSREAAHHNGCDGCLVAPSRRSRPIHFDARLPLLRQANRHRLGPDHIARHLGRARSTRALRRWEQPELFAKLRAAFKSLR